jgi:hypothetical protein
MGVALLIKAAVARARQDVVIRVMTEPPMTMRELVASLSRTTDVRFASSSLAGEPRSLRSRPVFPATVATAEFPAYAGAGLRPSTSHQPSPFEENR